MVGKKVKLEIIENVVRVKNIQTFCDAFLDADISCEEKALIEQLKFKSNAILQAYQKIMFRLKLLNISFAILQKELNFVCTDLNLPLTPYLINKKQQSLKNAIEKLKKQLGILHFNNFELVFLGVDEILNDII